MEIIASLTLTAIIRTLIGLVPVSIFAIPLFGVSIYDIGIILLVLLINLQLFGITLGILVSSGLIRFGPAFENIAWATLFLLAPLGCIYYPIGILPDWLQMVAKSLPLVYIFEEVRNILINQTYSIVNIFKASTITLLYFSAAIFVFYIAFEESRKKGTLMNMGE